MFQQPNLDCSCNGHNVKLHGDMTTMNIDENTLIIAIVVHELVVFKREHGKECNIVKDRVVAKKKSQTCTPDKVIVYELQATTRDDNCSVLQLMIVPKSIP